MLSSSERKREMTLWAAGGFNFGDGILLKFCGQG